MTLRIRRGICENPSFVLVPRQRLWTSLQTDSLNLFCIRLFGNLRFITCKYKECKQMIFFFFCHTCLSLLWISQINLMIWFWTANLYVTGTACRVVWTRLAGLVVNNTWKIYQNMIKIVKNLQQSRENRNNEKNKMWNEEKKHPQCPVMISCVT